VEKSYRVNSVEDWFTLLEPLAFGLLTMTKIVKEKKGAPEGSEQNANGWRRCTRAMTAALQLIEKSGESGSE